MRVNHVFPTHTRSMQALLGWIVALGALEAVPTHADEPCNPCVWDGSLFDWRTPGSPCIVICGGDPEAEPLGALHPMCIIITDGYFDFGVHGCEQCCALPDAQNNTVCVLVGDTLSLGIGVEDRDLVASDTYPYILELLDSPEITVEMSGADLCYLDYPGFGEFDCAGAWLVTGTTEFDLYVWADDRVCAPGFSDDAPQDCTVHVKPMCAGPNYLTVGDLDPDGESTTIARTIYFQEVDWQFVGNSLGCSIERCPDSVLQCWDPTFPCANNALPVEQSVRIRAGFRTGEVTLRVFDKNFPECYLDQLILVGCPSCPNNECGPGSGVASVDRGLSLQISVGNTPNGESAGQFYIRSDGADKGLTTPRSLRFSGGDGTTVITYTDYPHPGTFARNRVAYYTVIDEIRTASVWADVVFSDPTDELYRIDLRRATDTLSDPPFSSWIIDNDGTTSAPELRAEHWTGGLPNSGGTLQRAYRFVYTDAGGGASTWELYYESENGTPIRKAVSDWTPLASDLSRYIATYDYVNGVPILSQDREEIWTTFTWGRELTIKHVNTGNATLTTVWDYFDAPNHPAGCMKYELRPDGSWTWYTYYGDGRPHTMLSPWNDLELTPPTAPDPALCRQTKYTYDDIPTGSDPITGRVSSVTDTILGIPVAVTLHTHLEDGNDCPQTLTQRCINPTNAVQDHKYLSSTITWWDQDRKYIKLVEHPDGRLDAYTNPNENVGSFSVTSSGVPTFGGVGDDRRYTIEHLFPGPVASKSTKDVVVVDEGGRRVWEESLVYISNGYDATPINRTVRDYDWRGQLTTVWHSNNTTTQYVYGCCGLDEVTDASGVTTLFARDALGRITHRTKKGIGTVGDPDFQDAVVTATDHAHDGSPLQIQVTVHDQGDTLALDTVQEFDRAGRIVRSVDESELETLFSYTVAPTGGPVTTRTDPSGTVIDTEYSRDGRVKRVTCNGVAENSYAYGVNADGSQWTTVFMGPDETSSDRWAKTTIDAVGRTIRSERPAYASSQPVETVHEFDNSAAGGGRLKAVRHMHNNQELNAPTLFEYDDVGALTRTGLDLDGNGDLAEDSESTSDRIVQHDTSFVKIGSVWWRATAHKVYIDETAVPVVVERTREQLTGLTGSTISISENADAYNEVTRTTTTLSNDAVVTTTVDYPATNNTAVTVTQNGLPLSMTDKAQLTTSQQYDALGRVVRTTDSRLNWTEVTHNDDTGQVESIANNHGDMLSYAYYDQGQAGAGQLKSLTNSLNNSTYFDYDSHGRVVHTWGHVTQPTFVEYTELGELWKLHTYGIDPGSGQSWADSTWPTNAGDGDMTLWTYDKTTGLLKSMDYGAVDGESYAYTPDGKCSERLWVREVAQNTRLKTTYEYSTGAGGTGELLKIDYHDSITPDVEVTYNRAGQLATVDDAVTALSDPRSIAYDARLQPLRETFPSGSLFGNRQLYTNYTDGVAFTPPGGMPEIHRFVRLGQLGFGPPSAPTSEYSAVYDYDGNSDRMNKVTGPGLPNGGALYKYLGESGSASSQPANLVERIQFKSSSTVQVETVRAYEPSRDLLASVENTVVALGNPPLSRYTYINDAIGNFTSCARGGAVFGIGGGIGDHHDVWAYNARNELAISIRRTGTSIGDGSIIAAAGRGYGYDHIGNRTKYDEGDSARLYYCANDLNQYEFTDDASACPPESGQETERFEYDEDGNLTRSNNVGTIAPGSPLRTVRYDWDAENRLIRIEPTSAQTDDKKSEFRYDYLGRRIEKTVSVFGAGNWGTPEITRYIWHNWRVLAETDGSSSPVVKRRYVWGLDLAGQMGSMNSLDSAGGIGGLLSIYDYNDANPDLKYIYCYDGSGAVAQLVDPGASTLSSAIAARYEYDAYGIMTLADGAFADTNPWRFSTKYFDENTRLGYWGHRYYSPTTGRWLNRDPLGHLGGVNLYAYGANQPTIVVDPLGMKPLVWTGSGINNWDTKRVSFVDYVAEKLTLTSDASFVSRCGVDAAYKPGQPAAIAGGQLVLGLGSETLMDYEAETFAKTRSAGEMCGQGCQKRIKVILVAPKTTTVPNIDTNCCTVSIDVLFSPEDMVPNQSYPLNPWHRWLGNDAGLSRFAEYWQKFAVNGSVVTVNTYQTPGYQARSGVDHHSLNAFIGENGSLTIGAGFYSKGTPDAPSRVNTEINSDNWDYVMVGHSQGTNILLHVLNQICNKRGIGVNVDGAPQK